MGNYSNSISERIKNVRIKEGYCLICSKYGELTMDHVPPKSAITITKIEQKHIFELLKGKETKIKGVQSHNGSRFKTICINCNNNLVGKNDIEVSNVIKEINKKIKNHFNNARTIYNSVSVPFNSLRFCRAMIGHILSATTVEQCKIIPVESPYFTPLQKFVLGDDFALDNTHDIYYWFYPYKMHLSCRIFAFRNKERDSTLSILSFFPIAFLLTEKNNGIGPAHSTKLNLKDKNLTLNLSTQNLYYANFPLVKLDGNQILLTLENNFIVSYPIK